MGIEIERKFLVDISKLPVLPIGKKISQGYLLAHSPSIRVRVSDDMAFITIKGSSNGTISRSEYEYEIPHDDALELLEQCSGLLITKTRYEIEHDGHIWELDIFEGENSGLVVAEIELSSEDEKFTKPHWTTNEVSHESRYANSALSIKPFNKW